MPIDFPTSPTDGQIYTVGSRSWTWSAANSSWNATSITTGPKGGIPYQFSTTITDADPGNGFIRYNNSTIGSVTFIYIDLLDSNGNTQTAWYDTFDDSTNPSQEGYLYIQGNNASSTVVNIFSITGAVTDTAGYYKIPVTHVSGSLPANSESISVSFVRTGNQGTQGTTGSQGTTGTQGLTGTQGTTGPQGTTGAQGTTGTQGTASGVPLTFNSGLTSTSSTAGQFNFNNATVSSVTAVYINNSSASSLAVFDQLWMTLGSTFAQFQVSSAPSLSGSTYTIPVTHQSSTGTFTNGVIYSVLQGNVGIQGTTGTQGTTGAQGIQGIIGPTGVDTVTSQTGATYTFVLADKDNLVRGNSASAQTFSIPTNASVAFAIGDAINVIQIGAGQVTINAVTPATTIVQSTGATAASPKTRAQFSMVTLIKAETDRWYVTGDLV